MLWAQKTDFSREAGYKNGQQRILTGRELIWKLFWRAEFPTFVQLSCFQRKMNGMRWHPPFKPLSALI